MPYKLKKAGTGYFVINTNSKKKYSKKPIPKLNAEKQIRLLRMIEKKK